MEFDFFYKDEPKQYAFYSIPQLLFTDEKFEKLSCEAKVLYGLLLDLAGLSSKNGWTDENGKVYVYYKREDVCNMLGCAKDKATKILAELDDNKGIGLIKRVPQGQGKPAKIYVKHFLRIKDENAGLFDNPANSDAVSSESDDDLENETALLGAEKSPSKGRKNRLLEGEKTDRLYNIQTNISNFIETSKSIYQPEDTNPPSNPSNYTDVIDAIEYAQKISEIKERIEYAFFQEKYSNDIDIINEVVDVIAWAELTKRRCLKVNGENLATEIVRERLSVLDESHIEYVLDCIKEQTTKISQRRNYLLTCLFNAPITIDGYYANLVKHDMYGGGYN